MRIDILKDSGFCGGVNRALFLLDKCLKENPGKCVYLLGPIVHNDSVNRKFEARGAKIISKDDLYKLNDGDIIVSSAHGISDKLRESLKRFKVIDTTCPFVRKNQLKINDVKGSNIIFIGKKNHTETIALTEDNSDILIVESEKDLFNFKSDSKGYVFNQTTFNMDKLSRLHKMISNKAKSFIIDDTTCLNTINIQSFLKTVDPKYSVLIVVGDKKSNNANSLYELSPYKKTYFIQNMEDCHTLKLSPYDNIIIIGSASTPKELLVDIKKRITDILDFIIE